MSFRNVRTLNTLRPWSAEMPHHEDEIQDEDYCLLQCDTSSLVDVCDLPGQTIIFKRTPMLRNISRFSKYGNCSENCKAARLGPHRAQVECHEIAARQRPSVIVECGQSETRIFHIFQYNWRWIAISERVVSALSFLLCVRLLRTRKQREEDMHHMCWDRMLDFHEILPT